MAETHCASTPLDASLSFSFFLFIYTSLSPWSTWTAFNHYLVWLSGLHVRLQLPHICKHSQTCRATNTKKHLADGRTCRMWSGSHTHMSSFLRTVHISWIRIYDPALLPVCNICNWILSNTVGHKVDGITGLLNKPEGNLEDYYSFWTLAAKVPHKQLSPQVEMSLSQMGKSRIIWHQHMTRVFQKTAGGREDEMRTNGTRRKAELGDKWKEKLK